MSKKTFLFIFLFMVTLFSPTVIQAENNSVSLYLEASKLENAGEYVKAADIIAKMLTEEKSSHLYSKLAELLISAGEDDRAISSLQQAEKDYPSDPYFKFLLGRLFEFYKRNPKSALQYYIDASKISDDLKYLLSASRAAESAEEYKTALQIMDKVIEQNQGVSDLYADRGRIHQRLGMKSKSIADLKKAMEIDGNMPAMLRLADIYLTDNNTTEAKKILEKIAEQKGGLIIPELKLGDIYKNEKDYVKAIELYSQVADKLEGKDRAMVLKQLGILQYETGDTDNATISFKWVTELTPEDTLGAYFYGYILETQENYDEAKRVYEKALEYNPKYAQLLKRLAAIDIIQNNGEKSRQYLEKIDPVEYDVDYYLLLSESYNAQKDHNKAAIVLIDALNENPTDTTVLYALAMQYELLKERPKAVDTLKKALSIQPENPILQNFLGYLYAEMGTNLEEAYTLIVKALEKEPENAAYLDSLGWVYFKQKNYKKALEYIERAYSLSPEDPEIKEHMEKIKKMIK